MNLWVLRAELIDDPLSHGYSGMTDQEAADDLNAEQREKLLARLDGAVMFEAIDQTEWESKTAGEQQEVNDILHIGTAIGHLVTPGSRVRTRLVGIFGTASATGANLQDARRYYISRARELSLGLVKAGHVAKARSLS